MPGFRAHYLFGNSKEIMEAAPSATRHPTCFYLGLQGPDIFFFSPPAHLLYAEHLGGMMHQRNTGQMFEALCRARNQLPHGEARRIADAYISGFIGHYTLDTTVHPYVHYRTKKVKNADKPLYTFGIHVLLETDMDIALLRHFRHLRPSQFKCSETVRLSREERGVVCHLLSEAIKDAYPTLWARPAGVALAIFCMRLVNDVFHDRDGRRKALFRWFDERLFGFSVFSSLIATDTLKTYPDPLNLRHKLWRNPWDLSRSSSESVYDLFRRATRLYLERLHLYRAATREKADGATREKADAATREKADGATRAFLSSIGSLSYDSGM